MHGDVRPAVEDRGLHLLGEGALARELGQHDASSSISFRVDHDELGLTSIARASPQRWTLGPERAATLWSRGGRAYSQVEELRAASARRWPRSVPGSP